MLQTFRKIFFYCQKLAGVVLCSVSCYSGESATVFNYCRHAFARLGTLQKALGSVSRYFSDLIQLYCRVFEKEKAMPKTEWRAQDSS